MKNPPVAVTKYMAAIGSKGGKATGAVKARDPKKMRAAALKRWKTIKPRNPVTRKRKSG